jgi:hypothetical protein
VFDSATIRGICRIQPGLILQVVAGTIPFTVIHETALLSNIEFYCYWLVAACPSAPVTCHHFVAIEGTTYSPNPFNMTIYPGDWTIPFGYGTVALDIATTYHTAAIVRILNTHLIDF